MNNNQQKQQQQQQYQYQRQHQGQSTGSGYYGGYSANSDYVYQIKMLIQNGNFIQAQRMLDAMPVRDATWNYLQGLLFLKRGWYERANAHLRRAVEMDPSNMEYRDALSRVNTQYNAYRYNPNFYGAGYRQGPDMCQICGTLWCADSICECLGGDLISCC